MKKWLVKMFCPSAKSLADYAAAGVQDAMNGTNSERRALVAKYAMLAANATEVSNRLAKMVEDGSIEDKERDELSQMLEPVFDKALKYAFNW